MSATTHAYVDLDDGTAEVWNADQAWCVSAIGVGEVFPGERATWDSPGSDGCAEFECVVEDQAGNVLEDGVLDLPGDVLDVLSAAVFAAVVEERAP